jgi:iron-sulfur cluster repair protein YtfE (RIC family)
MKIEELKYEIFAQHHLLRALLVDVGAVAELAAGGDTLCAAVLRKGAHQLADELLRHMADEERILEELAREGHGPAAEHLQAVKHNHVHQRTLIASISARVDAVHATKRLGEIIEALTHAVILDMEHEEAALFGASSVVPLPPQQRVARVA